MTTDSTSTLEIIVTYPGDQSRRQYEADLARRQREHLDAIGADSNANWSPCMHDACPECVGTGVKRDGSSCIHFISCPCPRCTPHF